MSSLSLRLFRAATDRGMRALQLGDDGLCAVQCRGCGWTTPRDVVGERYVAGPHSCLRCYPEDSK